MSALGCCDWCGVSIAYGTLHDKDCPTNPGVEVMVEEDPRRYAAFRKAHRTVRTFYNGRGLWTRIL